MHEPEAIEVGAERVAALRTALQRYKLNGSAVTLDRAFVAAAAAIAHLRGERAAEPAGASEVQELLLALPEFGQLVSVATAHAERAAGDASQALWQRLGLLTSPPAWDDSERAGARLLIACACVPPHDGFDERLGPRLRRLAAARWAGVIAGALSAAPEYVWERLLGERYDSVRRRYAPRGWLRTGELRELFARSDMTTAALRSRLTAWLSGNWDFDTLSATLEAAFVQTRNPSQVA